MIRIYLILCFLSLSCISKKDKAEEKYEKDFQKCIVNNYHNNTLSKIIIIDSGLKYYASIYLSTFNKYDTQQKPLIIKIPSIIDFRNDLIHMK